MLVLSRKTGEKIVIDNRITIVVNRISGNRVTLGIDAPSDVHVLRGELEVIANEFRDKGDKDKDGPISLPIRSAVG
jgi:carbon storage regulator CsrA